MTATTTMTARIIKAKTGTQTPMMILCSVVNPELSGSWGAAVVVLSITNKEYVIPLIIYSINCPIKRAYHCKIKGLCKTLL